MSGKIKRSPSNILTRTTQSKLGVTQINYCISITCLLLDDLLSINDHLIHVNFGIWENVP